MKKEVKPMTALLVMLFSMVAAAMALHKVPPILSVLMGSLHIQSSSKAGLLISIFVISGIILTIPIGYLVERMGLYKMGNIALLSALIGSTIGGFASSYEVLLLSRIVEGIGLIVTATVGPIVVTRFFSGKGFAAAMGCLMIFMPFGQMISLLLSPRIEELFSWRAVWYATSAVFLLMLLIWAFLMKGVDEPRPAPQDKPAAEKASFLTVLTNRNLLLTCGTILCYLIVQQGTSGFIATYLSSVRGLSATSAASISSMASVSGIPAGILVGMISDKVKSRKWPIFILMLASGVSYLLMPVWPTRLYAILILYWGATANGIMGLCFSAGSEAVDIDSTARATSIMNTVQWVGVFLASMVFGALKDSFGWRGTFLLLVPIAIVGAGFAAVQREKGPSRTSLSDE